MNRKNTIILWIAALLLFLLVACGTSSTTATSTTEQAANSADTAVTTLTNAVTNAVTDTVSADAGAQSVTEAAAANSATHDDAEDYVLDDAQTVKITLNGSTITADSAAVTVDGSTATITAAGTYSLSGSLTDGQIIVDTADEATVHLILNGADMTNFTGAPLYIANAEEVVIVLADGSQNTLTDGSAYVFADAEEDEPNAALFSKADLTIYGNGSLTVNGNYNDGIASKDGLVIAGGTITVNAIDDGIRGKDYLIVKDANITVTAQGDGLKADNEEDATLGYIAIESGVVTITAVGDAIQAQTDVLITDGQFNLQSGGGSSSVIDETASAKGIKGVVNVNIDGGTFTINSADDAIHSNGSIVVNNGTFALTSGDDGLHADATLTINDGDIQIIDSYEGIESAVITINGGNIHVTSSDDGLNVAGGNDASGTNMGPGFGGGGQRPRGGGPGQTMASQDTFNYTGSYYLYINGGYIVVDAAGDGVDVNGAIEMTDGVVLVNGPTEQMNGALDYDAGFKITGGFFVAVGSAGMAQAPGAASTQNSLLLNFNGTGAAGTLIHIQSSDGTEILTFAPTKQFQSIAFSSPELVSGETYNVYVGGSSTGAAADGLVQDGTYTPGDLYTNFTVSSIVTQIGGNIR
jgi:hypothetical protein